MYLSGNESLHKYLLGLSSGIYGQMSPALVGSGLNSPDKFLFGHMVNLTTLSLTPSSDSGSFSASRD